MKILKKKKGKSAKERKKAASATNARRGELTANADFLAFGAFQFVDRRRDDQIPRSRKEVVEPTRPTEERVVNFERSATWRFAVAFS